MPELDTSAAAVLTASRALLAVVARSIAPELDRVTVPQFRVLVILSTAGAPVRNRDLADALGVHPSTFTRNADRLVSGGWVRRAENPENRRETLVSLTAAGRRLVDRVTARRRDEIREVLARLTPAQRRLVLEAMTAFAHAAGEPDVGDLAEFSL
ncbi:MAG TPA: MarR family transcriptional regulator [Candidatus Nanopelagicales bacterium]|nr:MarR family transcriptional regulator [Candidatus Nanopelagicales bacterium]